MKRTLISADSASQKIHGKLYYGNFQVVWGSFYNPSESIQTSPQTVSANHTDLKRSGGLVLSRSLLKEVNKLVKTEQTELLLELVLRRSNLQEILNWRGNQKTSLSNYIGAHYSRFLQSAIIMRENSEFKCKDLALGFWLFPRTRSKHVKENVKAGLNTSHANLVGKLMIRKSVGVNSLAVIQLSAMDEKLKSALTLILVCSSYAFLSLSLGISLLAGIVFSIVLWYLDDEKTKNLPPGHPQFPLIGCLNMLFHKHQYEYAHEAHKKYGPIINASIGKVPFFLVGDYEMIKELSLHPEFQLRPDIGLFAEFHKKLGLVASEGELWKHQRRFIIHSLRDSGMGTFRMQEKIHDELDKGHGCSRWIQR
ncbi:Cytochrome P450 2J3 [Nymphon striatum]|nr:Cytochrome P450 2J3 [Nymphon striatum]